MAASWAHYLVFAQTSLAILLIFIEYHCILLCEAFRGTIITDTDTSTPKSNEVQRIKAPKNWIHT